MACSTRSGPRVHRSSPSGGGGGGGGAPAAPHAPRHGRNSAGAAAASVWRAMYIPAAERQTPRRRKPRNTLSIPVGNTLPCGWSGGRAAGRASLTSSMDATRDCIADAD
ncbi:Os03g0731025 [Oryza sativa Japonica Group]|uniref:Os03g0731025 protein n=1 Tax=Oryza sativa subsp. japonica TaxID=39947 RepID=A0A0P0W2X7_ORYSJ|nr:hypothetical protein EE612_020243 [Oryza sativa]BAS86222.1 Os03g0731025 [Oryza sativa Japonica Group]